MSGLASLYDASQKEVVVFDMSERSLVKVSGPERVAFLNSVLSPDLAALSVGSYTHGGLLEPKGKYLFSLQIWITEDAVLIDTDPGRGGELAKQLLSFKFRAKVTIEDLSGHYHSLCITGPDSPSVLSQVGLGIGDSAVVVTDSGFICRTTVPQPDSLLVYTTGSLFAERLQKEAVPADAELFTALRTLSGEPAWGAELTPEVIPMEALQQRALSFTKCYPGQEVVSRIHYRGHVNRVLQRFEIETSGNIEQGVAVMDGDKQVGQLTTATRHPSRDGLWIALGYIRRDVVLAGRSTLIQAENELVEARVLPLPYQSVT